MKLGDILRTAGTSRPAVMRPVPIRVGGEADNFSRLIGEGRACFCYVSEEDRSRALVAARKVVHERMKNDALHGDMTAYITDQDIRDEQTYQILFLALRDADPDDRGRHSPFASSVDELRTALSLPVVQDLWEEYQRYLAEEFPPFVDKETWEALVADAKKGCLSDLLISYGSGKRRQALVSLVIHSGAVPTQTSGAGELTK